MANLNQVSRIAVIDIGTNSTLMLVADVSNRMPLQPVFDTQEITRLGEGADETGVLRPEAMIRTSATVMEFFKKAQELGSRNIIIIGTSALRDAQNSQEFQDMVFHQTGVKIKVISGHQEADASFYGALSSGEFQSGSSLIIDCGGGSTEFIYGNPEKIVHKQSMEIGSIRLSERFLRRDPIDQSDFSNLTIFLDRFIHKHVSNQYRPDHTIGIGGTITTLANMAMGLTTFDPSRVHGYELLRTDIWYWLEKMWHLPIAARKRLPGLDPKRADTIVAGATIYATLLNYLDCDKIFVSTRGVRYGVLTYTDWMK